MIMAYLNASQIQSSNLVRAGWLPHWKEPCQHHHPAECEQSETFPGGGEYVVVVSKVRSVLRNFRTV